MLWLAVAVGGAGVVLALVLVVSLIQDRQSAQPAAITTEAWPAMGQEAPAPAATAPPALRAAFCGRCLAEADHSVEVTAIDALSIVTTTCGHCGAVGRHTGADIDKAVNHALAKAQHPVSRG